ncbi:MAG: hydrogenase expression/formation protein HypD [Gammaproteobacteria bacterium]|nr:MAG: hydrogenase expression/formation protein HypD [Gammaproteobacteria bacterium]TND02136.1 MAG: hydrogenase expression/formation protein HypD [Gammaproteobacteria bacterium]
MPGPHDHAKSWLTRIAALPRTGKVRILNVCGGHERTITHSGMRTALPDDIELIPGPGCPVCICPEEDIYDAIQLALNEDVMLVAFGDMLRVPVNVPKREPRSLEQAKAAGAGIQPIATPAAAAAIARAHPDRQVVFFAAGFETTMAPVAAMLAEGVPDNLSVLLSGRLTWPAVAMLLDSGEAAFDALVAPGHVATVMGADEWQFVPQQHGLPCAVAGFTPASLLAAFHSILGQLHRRQPALDNCYPESVTAGGNSLAKSVLARVMRVTDAKWRGIGMIPASGFTLQPAYSAHDARRRFISKTTAANNPAKEARKRIGEMPPGCDCAAVVLGKISPTQCALYGRACTPRDPVGPCMVSDEGACRIWWANGMRADATGRKPDIDAARA